MLHRPKAKARALGQGRPSGPSCLTAMTPWEAGAARQAGLLTLLSAARPAQGPRGPQSSADRDSDLRTRSQPLLPSWRRVGGAWGLRGRGRDSCSRLVARCRAFLSAGRVDHAGVTSPPQMAPWHGGAAGALPLGGRGWREAEKHGGLQPSAPDQDPGPRQAGRGWRQCPGLDSSTASSLPGGETKAQHSEELGVIGQLLPSRPLPW